MIDYTILNPMKYYIWYSTKSKSYNYGNEMDHKVYASLTGEDLDALYEMDESELPIVRKIVNQLNNARNEGSRHYQLQ